MTAKRSAAIDAARDAITAFGGTVLGVDYTHRHPRVNFRLPDGQEKFYVCSGSPSDHRCGGNVRTDLRHIFGLVGGEKPKAKRAPRKRYVPKQEVGAPPPAVLTPGANPFGVLATHPHADEVTRLRYHEAWHGLWAACMRTAGARSLIA